MDMDKMKIIELIAEVSGYTTDQLKAQDNLLTRSIMGNISFSVNDVLEIISKLSDINNERVNHFQTTCDWWIENCLKIREERDVLLQKKDIRNQLYYYLRHTEMCDSIKKISSHKTCTCGLNSILSKI